MNRINFNQSVGFPLETDILATMQDAFALMNAFGAIVGNFSIISGCEVVGGSVTAGTVYINGELLEFKPGVIQANVRIIETVQALEFEDTTTHDVVYTRYVQFGSATTNTFPWADFKRGLETKSIVGLLADKVDTSAIVAINNAITVIQTKLATIEPNAQKNVQSNWEQTNDTADDFIKNKPGIITYLHIGVHNVNDAISTDSFQTVNFPDVGTNNYMVLGELVSNGGNFDNDNDVIRTIRDRTNTSFKILLREMAANVQDLTYEYILIPKP